MHRRLCNAFIADGSHRQPKPHQLCDPPRISRGGRSAIIGSAAGYTIYRSQTQRKASAAETRQRLAYKPDQRLTLKLHRDVVAPYNVRPGGTVMATVEYALLGGAGQGTRVDQVRTLERGKGFRVELNRKSLVLGDGTWENTIKFKVPADAEPGLYTLKTQINAQKKIVLARSSFRVLSKSTRRGRVQTAVAPGY